LITAAHAFANGAQCHDHRHADGDADHREQGAGFAAKKIFENEIEHDQPA